MWEDPTVAEIREVREKLAATFGFDVNAICAAEADGARKPMTRAEWEVLVRPMAVAEGKL